MQLEYFWNNGCILLVYEVPVFFSLLFKARTCSALCRDEQPIADPECVHFLGAQAWKWFDALEQTRSHSGSTQVGSRSDPPIDDPSDGDRPASHSSIDRRWKVRSIPLELLMCSHASISDNFRLLYSFSRGAEASVEIFILIVDQRCLGRRDLDAFRIHRIPFIPS